MKKFPIVLEVATEMAFTSAALEQSVALFGEEKTRAVAMCTSVGGIGPLMRERVIGQAEAGIDVVAVSLLYEYVWVQKQNAAGHLVLEKIYVGEEQRKLLKPTPIHFQITLFDDQKVNVDVWSLDLGPCQGYYLGCPEIADAVYPGSIDAPLGTADPGFWAHVKRLKQNWVLGRGALQLSKELNKKPDVVILSETPTIFGIHRFFKDRYQNDPFFSETRYIYNDHTPLEYAHPLWDEKTIDLVKLDARYCKGSKGWNKKNHHLDITSMTVEFCERTFGVAQKHGDIIRAMPSLKPFVEKIDYVTNGIRQADWQIPEFRDIQNLSDEKLFSIKEEKKQQLLHWLEQRLPLVNGWAKKAHNMRILLLTRRITAYKRLDVLNRLFLDDKLREEFLKLNLVLIVGGRIHQQDQSAFDLAAALMDRATADPQLKDRILFFANFNVWEAPRLYEGVDGAIMMSDNQKEASATGFMKAQMNGGAVIASSDGAVPEFVHFLQAGPNGSQDYNGFLIPYVDNQPTPEGLLKAFSQFDQVWSDAKMRAQFMRAAISRTPQLDIHRTVRDMIAVYEKTLQSPVVAVAAKR